MTVISTNSLSMAKEIITEPEILDRIKLCDSDGNLNKDAIGFSRQPFHECNLSKHWPRKKKWNYWCITSADYLFSVTLSNIDYLGLAFTYFLDFKTKKFIEKTIMRPFGSGCSLPMEVNQDVTFTDSGMPMSFTHMDHDIQLKVAAPEFGQSNLAADFLIEHPINHETMNVVIPWNMRQFQFTSKQNCLPASGKVILGEQIIIFEKGSSFACLDYGRGIWPFECFWNWSSFSGNSGTHIIGVNLGGKWTDGTGMTENGIIVDGKLSKLSEDITFTYDNSNFMKPWSIRTRTTNRVDLCFTPFFERVAKTNALIIKSEVHQMIGKFSGKIIDDTGETIQIENIIGWAEEHQARW